LAPTLRDIATIGCVTLGTNDLRRRAKSFYDALSAEMGARRMMEFGGTGEGPPGLRAEGGDGFYVACFRDLDGNKLDVFCCG
jgi:hypothetical protein